MSCLNLKGFSFKLFSVLSFFKEITRLLKMKQTTDYQTQKKCYLVTMSSLLYCKRSPLCLSPLDCSHIARLDVAWLEVPYFNSFFGLMVLYVFRRTDFQYPKNLYFIEIIPALFLFFFSLVLSHQLMRSFISSRNFVKLQILRLNVLLWDIFHPPLQPVDL